jgi:branched-chain amino acid transport system substrate-binding protein
MTGSKGHWTTTAVVLLALGIALLIGVETARSQAPDPITVGAVISVSGRDSAFGQECLSGLRLAVDEANAEGGVSNHPISLEVYDDRSDPILAAEGVRVLVKQYHPLAVVGSNTSMVTSAAAVAAQNLGVPLVVPEATNPAITSIGDCIYRVCFVDPDMANALATFAYQRLGVRKVAILMEENHDYTMSLTRYFSRRFRELGGEITLQMGYNPGARQFDDPLRLAQERKADAILVSGFYPEAAAILESAKAKRLDLVFLGGDAWESDGFFAMAGDAITDKSRIFVASHFSPDVERVKVKGFVSVFEQRYHRRPNTSSALGYDAMGVVLDAIAAASSLTQTGIRASLLDVHHEGVTGRIAIDSTRSTSKKVIIMKAMPDRRFAFVQAVSATTDTTMQVSRP